MGRGFGRGLRARLTRAVGMGVLTVALLCLLCAGMAQARPKAPSPPSPEQFGPLAVHVTHVRIPVPIDPHGPEGAFSSLGADVYVPAGAGRRPLVQISHAWPGTLREFPLSGWARRLASRGFAVIVSDRRGGSAALTPQLDQLADLQDLSSAVNSEDILRVLRWAIAQDASPTSPLHGRVDRRRLAIAGHSLGGYFGTFAAVRSRTEGPRLSALVLLDPTDERLGDHTLDSSLAAAPSVAVPTIVLGSEANQHPIMCDMSQGTDCTIVSRQEYAALTGARPRFGLKVVGAVHEDVEDPNTGSTPSKPKQLRMFERYGMAWLEYWVGNDCRAAGYLGGRQSAADAKAGAIALYKGARPVPTCVRGRVPPG